MNAAFKRLVNSLFPKWLVNVRHKTKTNEINIKSFYDSLSLFYAREKREFIYRVVKVTQASEKMQQRHSRQEEIW